jgi:hypothetical protein
MMVQEEVKKNPTSVFIRVFENASTKHLWPIV